MRRPPERARRHPVLGGRVGKLDRLPNNAATRLPRRTSLPGAAPARGFYNLAPRLTISGASSLTANHTVDGFDNGPFLPAAPSCP